jgi:hypothetical protein
MANKPVKKTFPQPKAKVPAKGKKLFIQLGK